MLLCDVFDAIELCGLVPRVDRGSTRDYDCPFCQKQKKLHADLSKNAWRCPACGRSGGVYSFYAQYNDISMQDAAKEIEKSLASSSVLTRNAMERISIVPDHELAPLEVRDKTYRAFLKQLRLSEAHREDLQNRGLTDADIKGYGYKSVPAFGVNKIIETLCAQGRTLAGVPGFFKDSDGSWRMNLNTKASGYFVPVLSMDGRVQGMQIRMDKAFEDGRKYIWLSSAGRPEGVSSGSLCHFVGDPAAETVWFTEGGLKATVAQRISKRCFGKDRTFVAVSGVSCYKSMEWMLDQLKENGTVRIVEAFDMDKLTNPHVAEAVEKFKELVVQRGFQYCTFSWDAAFKGIDDFFLHKAAKNQIV